MVPLAGPRSTRPALKTTSLYQAAKSSLWLSRHAHPVPCPHRLLGRISRPQLSNDEFGCRLSEIALAAPAGTEKGGQMTAAHAVSIAVTFT